MKQFAYALIDFDYTLYETQRLVAGLQKIFADCGVSEADYRDTINQASTGTDGQTYNYTFGRHISLLRERGYTIPDATEDRLQAELQCNYRAEDAVDFLKKIREVAETVYILTAGNQAFQMAKINVSELLPFVDEVIIVPSSQGKAEIVRELNQKGGRILFVNDEVEQNNQVSELGQTVLVLGKKHPRRHQPEMAGSVPYFDNLTEIIEYLKTI